MAKEAQHQYLDVSLPYQSLMVSVTPRHLLILAGNSVFIFIQQQQRRDGPYAIVTSLSSKFRTDRGEALVASESSVAMMT